MVQSPGRAFISLRLGITAQELTLVPRLRVGTLAVLPIMRWPFGRSHASEVKTHGCSWAYSCWPPNLCVSLCGTVRRIMRITLPDWCRWVRVVAAVVVLCSALSLTYGGHLEPVKAASSQASAAPADSLEILEVRPFLFVIAAGSNIGVQIGEDGVVVV